MKTDRELLELAASAAGLEVVFLKNRIDKDKFFSFSRSGGDQKPWNPLDHDGDALRLAVKLGLTTLWFDKTTGRPEVVVGLPCGSGVVVTEPLKNDPLKATRRAITRAAAQMQLNKEQANG